MGGKLNLVPKKGGAADVDLQNPPGLEATAWHFLYSEVQDDTSEVVHMLRVNFAEISEVMLPHKELCSRLHRQNVQAALVRNKISVFPKLGCKPAKHHHIL